MSTMRPLPMEAGTPPDELLFREDAYAPKPRALDNRVVAPAAPRNFRRENWLSILSIIVLLRDSAIGTGPRFRATPEPKRNLTDRLKRDLQLPVGRVPIFALHHFH